MVKTYIKFQKKKKRDWNYLEYMREISGMSSKYGSVMVYGFVAFIACIWISICLAYIEL